ncbi:MAG: DUF2399 domain-containing protein [Peptococcaceae bacterium]|nr:DUF2399 domain-containing protein [Peptococcaceae bacterium]
MVTEPGSLNQIGKKYINRILSLLLSKYERSKVFREGGDSFQRPQFILQESVLAVDYNDELDYRKREIINQVLLKLEADGLVEVRWAKFMHGKQAEKVYLQLGAVDEAYALAGITPKAEKLESLLKVLEPLHDHHWEWVRSFWQTTHQKLKARKSAGLNLEDLEGYMELVTVLKALPSLEDIIPKRVFSQRILGDSKRFEADVEPKLVSLLKKYGPDEFERDDEYLDSIGIVAHPKPAFISGPIEFEVDGEIVDVSKFVGGVGLFPPTVKNITVSRIISNKLITIENLTSYHQMTEIYPDLIVVYTGGFPHRTVQSLLKRISEYFSTQSEEPLLFHWGDIDYGGLRIYQYIKTRFFPRAKPLWMDSATYLENLNRGNPFDDDYTAKLRALQKDPGFIEFHALIGLMLAKKIRIEQESLDPAICEFRF